MFRKMFTLSFDDGTVQDRRLIELIDKYNLRATFNINSGFLGQNHNINHHGINVCHDEVDASELKQLYRNHEVAVHTVTHPNLKCASEETVISQVLDDYRALTELSGKDITGMAYPCGGACYDDRVIRLIRENTPVRYARTTDSHGTFALPTDFMKWHPTCHQFSDNLMQLAESFINTEATEDMLFYVWGHSFELDKYEGSWEKFEEFCKMISARLDITYMTNGEIYRYATKKGLAQ